MHDIDDYYENELIKADAELERADQLLSRCEDEVARLESDRDWEGQPPASIAPMISSITIQKESADGKSEDTYEGTEDYFAGRRIYRKPDDDAEYVLVVESMMSIAEYLDALENKHA